MKKLFAIIMSMLMIACFMPTMAFAEQPAGNAATSIDLGTFINWLETNEYNVDGSTYSNTNAVQDGKLNVAWSPVSGCFKNNANSYAATCSINSGETTHTPATGNTPNRANDHYAQYQLCNGTTNNVMIKNVNFVYTPGTFAVCGNTGWAGPQTQTIPAELQFQNNSSTTLVGCTFDKVGLSNWDENTGNTVIVKDCKFKDINGNCFEEKDDYYAIHYLKSDNIYVSGNTFENVCRGMMVYAKNNNQTYIVGNNFSGVTTGKAMIKVDGTNLSTNLVVFGNTDSNNRGTVCRMANNITIHAGTNDNITYTNNSTNKNISTADIGSVTVNGDGTITSTELKAAEIVRESGKTVYKTLEAAIENASAGDTITLLNDVTVNKQISVDKAITIDLNGKTWTDKAQPWVGNNGVLTIKDSGSSGKIELDGGGIMLNEGKLILNDGTIHRSKYGDNVILMGSAEFEMNGGSILADEGACIETTMSKVIQLHLMHQQQNIRRTA